jgi:hypothetical protein
MMLEKVGQSGLDLLLGPGGIALLQGFKAEATLIVVEEGEVGVVLRRLPEGAIQEDAGLSFERREAAYAYQRGSGSSTGVAMGS